MKKNFVRILLALTLCVCLVFAMTQLSVADFGGFAGDTDYGGGDWGGGYDDYDYDYDYGGSSGGGGSGGPFTYVIIAIVIIIFIVSSKRKGGKNGGTPVRVNTAPMPALKPIEQYNQLDPNFDAAKLTQKISNLYVQMQQGWQEKDIESLRPYFTDTLYSQMDRQLDALRRNGQTNYVERIAVLGVTLNGFCQSDGNDHIYATLNTRIVDYTVSDSDGRLISGSKTAEKFMTYRWHLVRPSGQTTASEDGVQSVECPNCAAPLSINQSAKCPYCGSVVTVEEHDFVLTDIQGISQRTA